MRMKNLSCPFFIFNFSLLIAVPSFSEVRLPEKDIRGTAVNDLPIPYNLQSVVLNKTVTLSWQWQPMEQSPAFIDFGFEVLRHDGKTAVISGASYSDFDIAPGTYSYRVRVRGGSKERGKRVTHVSDWSEPARVKIISACARVPTVELQVEATQKIVNQIPALRLHLTGKAAVEKGCTLGSLTYLLDTGTGIHHTGPLPYDEKGRFDTFVNPMGPEDEAPEGSAFFTVSATAENEAGPVTSNAYTISVELQNKFAPRNP